MEHTSYEFICLNYVYLMVYLIRVAQIGHIRRRKIGNVATKMGSNMCYFRGYNFILLGY
jgi:hypothetical protein